jgi:sugar diacid utilization regulator
MADAVTATEQRFDVAPRRVEPDDSPDPLGFFAGLVTLAVESDDPAGLIAAAGGELGQPLALVSVTGEMLGHAPDNAHGRRALAVAAAAARTHVIPPPRWRVMPISHAGSPLAFLAIGDEDDGNGSAGRLLELIASLLGEQLTRAALVRGQTTAFVRRLVSEPGIGVERARQEAAALGMALADAYWPAVLTWAGAAPHHGLAESIDREARRLAGDSLTATVDGHVVVLHAGSQTASGTIARLEQLVARVRILAPSARAQAIAADGTVALGELSRHVAQLLRLCRFEPRAEPALLVVRGGQYALDRLLWENVATPEARAFVEDRLGALIAWDREHRSDLLRVLEAALDFPRHDHAASRCFMHRNTFRHRLRQATEVLGEDLEDADVRLAVHVALKLRRGLATPAPGPGAPHAEDAPRPSGAGRRRRPPDAANDAESPVARRRDASQPSLVTQTTSMRRRSRR